MTSESRRLRTRRASRPQSPMALSQSVVSELLDAFRAGEGVDRSRAPSEPCHNGAA
jgi:hypothetical protein